MLHPVDLLKLFGPISKISAPCLSMKYQRAYGIHGTPSCLWQLTHGHCNIREPHLKLWQRNANSFCWTVWRPWKIWQFSNKLCFKIAKCDVTYLGLPIRGCVQKSYFYRSELEVWIQLLPHHLTETEHCL